MFCVFDSELLCRHGIVFVPKVRNIFNLSPLNTLQWLIVFGASILPIIIMELQKKLNEIFFGKTVYEYKNAEVNQI